ncbi:MAG TPA: hypothetical protein VGW78_06930 [Candidatus Babeliales bacterium]|jgi:hypothetical protein|nr:hypothetical protein [Candidatus Babeliales bacterium]
MKLKSIAVVLVVLMVASIQMRCEDEVSGSNSLLDSAEQNQQHNDNGNDNDIPSPVPPQPLIPDANPLVDQQKSMQDIRAEQLAKLHALDKTLREPCSDKFAYYNKRLTSKKSEKRAEALSYFMEETALCNIKIDQYEQERSKKQRNALKNGGFKSVFSMAFVAGTAYLASNKTKDEDDNALSVLNVPIIIGGVIFSGIVSNLFEYIIYSSKSSEIDALQKPWIDNKIEIEKRFNWSESRQFFPQLQKESSELAEAYKKAYPIFKKNYDKRDISREQK